jgi:exopolysaccharide biosynthesis polyprenyl glycosylphosphotransferase
VIIILTAVLGLYAIRSTRGAWRELGRVVLVAVLWFVAVMGWYFLVRKELFYSRILLAHSVGFLVIFLSLGRIAVLLLERALMRHGIGVHLVASVGSQPVAESARRALEHDHRFRYLGHCASLADFRRLLNRSSVDLVLQTDPSPQSEQTIELIDYCRSSHVGYAFFPPVLADVPHLLQIDRLGLLPLIRFRPTPLDGWGRILKRLVDLLGSIVLIAVLSPVLFLIAVLIVFTGGRPVFYVSRRIGDLGKRKIPVLKFRSMVADADRRKAELAVRNERRDGPLFKIRNDPRVTPVGRFLRRFDLDELPQLFNVLLGHMSLVGPRPHLPDEVSQYRPYERRVFAVRPGITGLAQISGRSTLRFRDEVRLDLQYIEEWSLWLDLWILWRTVWVILGRKQKPAGRRQKV